MRCVTLKPLVMFVFSVHCIAEINSTTLLQLGGICKAITRDCPVMNGTLSELDAKLTTACDAATEETDETGHPARNKTHVVSVCERNRAMIRFTQEQNETCVSTVRIIHKKVNMALLW